MRVHVDTGPEALFHLTYCTNIHPGNGWSEVYANLQRYGPALKQRLAPDAHFGIGLRLREREPRTVAWRSLATISAISPGAGALRIHAQRLPVRSVSSATGQGQCLYPGLAR